MFIGEKLINRRRLYRAWSEIKDKSKLSNIDIDIATPIQIQTRDKRSVPATLHLRVIIDHEGDPITELQVKKDYGKRASGLLLAVGKSKGYLFTSRVDTKQDFEGNGLGSSLMYIREDLMRYLIDRFPKLQHGTVRARIHDTADSLSGKIRKGWSSAIAKKLGYEEQPHGSKYWFKTIRK